VCSIVEFRQRGEKRNTGQESERKNPGKNIENVSLQILASTDRGEGSKELLWESSSQMSDQ